MSDAEVIAAIRKRHKRYNIRVWERHPRRGTVRWERASVDPGGTIFGPGPYLHVPITMNPVWYGCEDEIAVRVYPPERLRKKLAKQWKRLAR